MSEPHRSARQPLTAPGEIDHHIADLTFTASADVTLQQVQDRLAQNEQWLPIDGDPQLSLGQLVASNSTGPLRLGFGAWRDLLLGMQFTTRGGSLITAGGRTMKNVAGYDLTKFMVGQHGLFGTIVTITARTWRRPTDALLARFEPSDSLLPRLLPTALRPQWSMISDGALFCGYLSDAPTIEFIQSQIESVDPLETKRQSPADDIAFRAARWLPPRPDVRFRASVPPAHVLKFLSEAELTNLAADPVFGIIVGSCDASQKASLRQLVQSHGGSVTYDDPDDRAAFFGAPAAQKALLKRLQSAFDA